MFIVCLLLVLVILLLVPSSEFCVIIHLDVLSFHLNIFNSWGYIFDLITGTKALPMLSCQLDSMMFQQNVLIVPNHRVYLQSSYTFSKFIGNNKFH